MNNTPKFKGGNELERLRRDNAELRKASAELQANWTALVEQNNNLVITICVLQLAQEYISRSLIPIHMKRAMETITGLLATPPTAESLPEMPETLVDEDATVETEKV